MSRDMKDNRRRKKKKIPKAAVFFGVVKAAEPRATAMTAINFLPDRASVHASGLCPRRSAEGAPSGFRLNISLRHTPVA